MNLLVSAVLEKIKETRLKFSQGSVTVYKRWCINYQKERVKLTNTQLNKLKSAAKNKKGTVFWLNMTRFEDEELLHVLFATRQSIKICNAVDNNTSAVIKLSKDQILKISQRRATVS